MTILTLLLGLIALIGGAELLVRGASRLAALLGVPPLIIGLTIVAIGTSTPELAVSIKAAISDHPDLIVGNCVGSNICNILFILGACALIKPLVVTRQIIWIEVPIMIGAHLLFLALSFQGVITRGSALLLFISCIGYILFAVLRSRNQEEPSDAQLLPFPDRRNHRALHVAKESGYFTLGLLFCLLGAGWLTDSAVAIARQLGVSELLIGLTIVAFGTSLPEVVTSIMAALRDQGEIGIGNIIGSCIFNILGIIGVAGAIAPEGIVVTRSALVFDLPVAIACTVSCLPIFFTGHRISRWEGAIFLSYYLAYIVYLILAAKQHHSLFMLTTAMLWFVIPLTVITFLIVMYRELATVKKCK